MDKQGQSAIPIDVISRGRDLGDVLSAYMDCYEKAERVAADPRKPEGKIFAETMQASIYRIYLLGVQDGMKGAAL